MNSANFIILFNLFILESLLSIDNAAVLALMVNDLPNDKKHKALKYGIAGAFVFRGLCLFFAAWMVKILWLKILGGLYLLYLVYGHFSPKKDIIEEGIDKGHNKIYLKIKNSIGSFWSTVILVEIMDIAFSIDNIFAAVAMTDNLVIIITGVCIGIVAMRFVSQWFTKLMVLYPTLENSAFIVILILGIKLILSGLCDYFNELSDIKNFMSNHWFDLSFSAIMLLVFIIPIFLHGKRKTYIKNNFYV